MRDKKWAPIDSGHHFATPDLTLRRVFIYALASCPERRDTVAIEIARITVRAMSSQKLCRRTPQLAGREYAAGGTGLLRVKMRLALEIVAIYGATRLRLVHNRLKLANHVPRVDPERAAGLSSEQTDTVAVYLSFAAVRILGWLPTHSSCLVRSLVVLRLLARWGVESCLVIGVRLMDDSLAAHAWVEYRGIPLLDSGGGDFVRLLEREAAGDEDNGRVANAAVACSG